MVVWYEIICVNEKPRLDQQKNLEALLKQEFQVRGVAPRRLLYELCVFFTALKLVHPFPLVFLSFFASQGFCLEIA